jgi:AcrR family transcriptional regulator
VGRIAGVSAEETRARLLGGAATVFAERGYDGASVSALAAAAGVSSGAIYAHFGSKAELFAATLRSHAPGEIERLLAVGPAAGEDALRTLAERGAALARRDPLDGALLVEAIVAAKRHPDVAALLAEAMAGRERRFTAFVEAGQAAGVVGDGFAAPAVARFVLMVVLGSLLASAMELPEVDDAEWATLITDVVDRLRP